jgi:hypothetical protein
MATHDMQMVAHFPGRIWEVSEGKVLEQHKESSPTTEQLKKPGLNGFGIFANANMHLVSAASAVSSAPLMTPTCSKNILVWYAPW